MGFLTDLVQIVLVISLLSGTASSKPIPKAFVSTKKSEAWHHGIFESLRAGVQRSAHSLLHYRTETPLHVPLEINIVLVGFDGDGAYRFKVDPEELRWFMQRSFPSHRPACQATGHELEIEQDLSYIVLPVGGLELQAVEREVQSHMRPAGQQIAADNSTMRLYDLEGPEVEAVFDRLYSYLFGQDPAMKSDADLERPAPAAIFITNFDKVRMDPRNPLPVDVDSHPQLEARPLSHQELLEHESGYQYHYTYNGVARTQAWVASGRYAVIDLSAGPCTYGQLDSFEGTVSPSTLPRVRDIVLPSVPLGELSRGSTTDVRQEFFHGRLSALLVSSIQHLYSPDVRFESLEAAHRVLIPVISLRNHNNASLLHQARLNFKALEAEVRRTIPPGQEVLLVEGAHSLHEHPRLALAVANAVRSRTAARPLPGGNHITDTRSYLDASFLVEEMRHSADMLAAGLLEAAHPTQSRTFFDHEVPGRQGAEHAMESPTLKKVPPKRRTILPVKPDWQPREGGGKTRAARIQREKSEQALAKTHGTRVIPVFILSLEGYAEGLLMDNESNLFVDDDVVLVLHTPAQHVPLSYVTEGKRCSANPSADVQRAVTAGVAAALGGLSAPYEKMTARHGELRRDWLWAAGHHPFGPFSNTSSLSLLLADTMLRNGIYSRVDTAIHGVRQSLKAIEEFSSEYLQTPFGQPVRSGQVSPPQWLDRLYNDPSKLPQPLPRSLVEKLEKNLEDIEEQLVHLAGLLYDHQLKEGHTLSTSLLQYVKKLYEYVQTELTLAREDMRCCQVVHRRPMRSLQAFLYFGILAAGFIVYFLVIFLSSPEQ